MYTPKQRMLNAYRNIKNDVIPAAPEFWFFYPAKVLGVTMAEFQREIPHYQGLLQTFKKFDCEGWGIGFPKFLNDRVTKTSDYKSIGDGKYRDKQKIIAGGKEYTQSYIYSNDIPCWEEERAVKNFADVPDYFYAHINEEVAFDLSEANKAHTDVGEDFLIEFDLGFTFFDYFEQFMGFENAAIYFMDEDEKVLWQMNEAYTGFQKRLLNEVVRDTGYEVFFVGCSSACNLLEGPPLWRKWDKPYLKAIVQEAHKLDKLVHNHNHGKIMETVPDLVEIGFDCVCPFERPPGDVEGLPGLRKVRELLRDQVTFNGNVHTIEALIKGDEETVRGQVREIKEAFAGSNRLIVGTGDQVGAETPEENIWAMIEEAHRKG